LRKNNQTVGHAHEHQALRHAGWSVDAGSTAMASLAFMGAVTLLLSAISITTSLALERTRLQVVADLGSLAAADTLRGLISGIPCENAELIAVSNGSFLDSCRIVGSDASVELTKQFGFADLFAFSEAGSPND
jgi:secretion/DNA translocation related TadE-like protein